MAAKVSLCYFNLLEIPFTGWDKSAMIDISYRLTDLSDGKSQQTVCDCSCFSIFAHVNQ